MSRLAIVVLVFSACATDSSSGITAESVVCPPDSTLTYETFGEVFISENCQSCHASKERPALGTQAAVQKNAKALINTAVTSTSMPRGTSMSIEDRELLGEWLACGAP